MKLVFDLEANGLLEDASLIHCIVCKDIETQALYKFEPHQVEQGLQLLMQADQVIAHNGIKYDLALASKLYPWFTIKRERVVDTLVLSRLIYTDLSDRDVKCGAMQGSGLNGRHSLEAWGLRLNLHKIEHEDWSSFSPEMLYRCETDVEVTVRLYTALTSSNAYSETASVLEHQVAHIVAGQERRGISFNEKAAMKLTGELSIKRQELEQQLQDTFRPFYKPVELKTPKVDNKKRGVSKGCPYTKVDLVVFNPSSRHHIADRLRVMRGWIPTIFTPSGDPKVDESVLKDLDYPEAKLLSEYFIVQKLLGYLAEGDKAWLKLVRNGKIHGEMITGGAVTGRATHHNPNLGQVPSAKKPYGKESRSLFTASKGRVLVGADAEGLELRMLGHYMSRFDNGEYAKDVVEGDIHTINQNAAGLPTRDNAKTFIYGFLYGAGVEKIGKIVGKGKAEGSKLRTRFLNGLPALKKLIETVKRSCDPQMGKGYLRGLDGRQLHIRSPHAALNTLLQSAGALICKRWMVEIDEMIEANGWRAKVEQVLWVHDELQFDCDPDIAEQFAKEVEACVPKAGAFFSMKVALTGKSIIGNTWAETH